FEAVTAEQIAAVGGTEPGGPPPEPPTDDPWIMVVSTGPDRIAAYVRSAIEREIARVVPAPEGDPNNTLSGAAFASGQLVGAGLSDRDAVVRGLMDAARGCGLGEAETRKTIDSGIETGVSRPRVLPESVKAPSRNGEAKAVHEAERSATLT